MGGEEVAVRPAQEADLPALTEIYNHYVVHTAVTFDIEPQTVEKRRAWFAQFGPIERHRLLVATLEDGRPVGYAGSTRFRQKPAYDTSIETTIYVAPGFTGRGIGTRLYDALFRALAGEDLHRAYGGVALPNPASLALHARAGFRPLGTYHEVGRKFGRYWDVHWLERPMA